jgi:DNA-binding NtrC family response regulator
MARILVIEQEPALLNLTACILRQDGHTITETRDPMEALSIVSQCKQEIDLVLTDVDTKPISGFEFVKRITAMGIGVPVLFTSDSSRLVDVITASLGAGSIVEVPFTAPALRHSLSRFLAKHHRKATASKDLPGGTKAA